MVNVLISSSLNYLACTGEKMITPWPSSHSTSAAAPTWPSNALPATPRSVARAATAATPGQAASPADAPCPDRAHRPSAPRAVTPSPSYAGPASSREARVGQERHPRRHQRHRPRGEVDELHAQFVLELLNLPAQRRLRHVQPLGGASEVPNVHPADCF